MKLTTAVFVAGVAGGLTVESHAAYTGISLENTNGYFSNHPNLTVRNAWLEGPSSQFIIWRLYANFNSNTAADRVNAVSGTPTSPFACNLPWFDGSFHNYTETPQDGKTVHFNTAFTGSNPVARSWDTYVTIGNAINGGQTQLSDGFAQETNNMGDSGMTIGPSEDVSWFVDPSAVQGRAVATAPSQAPAPPGVFRVLLAQFVLTSGTESLNVNLALDVDGKVYENQWVFVPFPSPGGLAIAAIAGAIGPRRRREA